MEVVLIPLKGGEALSPAIDKRRAAREDGEVRSRPSGVEIRGIGISPLAQMVSPELFDNRGRIV